MSEKNISCVNQLKNTLSKQLVALSSNLTARQKTMVCLNAEISAVTFARYTKGDLMELRNLELAEDLINKMAKLIK